MSRMELGGGGETGGRWVHGLALPILYLCFGIYVFPLKEGKQIFINKKS